MLNSYPAALTWLETLSSESAFFKKKTGPSLKAVNQALDLLDRPDKTYQYRIIIGGTAGKGTVCTEIEQTLVQEGKTVLHLSSPHLQVVNERIRLNGKLISSEDFTVLSQTLHQLIIKSKLNLTYYEVLVVMGILYGAQKSCEILLCEVGLGGEFDAVNAVQGSRLCGLTFIGDDHLEILGPERENIAETKAKIFTRESTFNVSYEQEFRTILNKNSFIDIVYIKGIKGKLNKKLARKILEQIISSKAFVMPKIALPCRWEKVSANIILDGAHSRYRFQHLISTKLKKSPGPYTLILGMQKRHDLKSFEILFPFAEHIIWTESGAADCYSTEALKKHYQQGMVQTNPLKALKLAETLNQPILVTGSLYLCGKIREHYYPSELILQHQTEWPPLN